MSQMRRQRPQTPYRQPQRSTRRPAQPVRRPAQPPRRRAPSGMSKLFGNPLFAVALIIAVVVIFVLVRRGGGTSDRYYCEGVYINDVDMSVYTREEGESMLREYARNLTDRQYTLTYEGRTWSFTPKQVGAKINADTVLEKAWNLGHTGSSSTRSNTMLSLRYSPQKLYTEYTYSEEKLDAYIESIASELYIAPVDADVVITATKPVVLSDSQDGRELDSGALKQTLVNAILYGGDETISLPVKVKHASVSSSNAEDGLQLIVTYSTSMEGSSSNRRNNVRLALSNFNGFAVKPGETVSFNEVVGSRTELNGYLTATVYYGASVTTGIGGGVCQASSTLYPPLLKAGMTIVERHNHTMVVAYCEASMDATVSEDAADDFVFCNDTDYTIYIYTSVTSEAATVMIYGRRPDYRIELVSTILQNDIKNTAVTYVKDESGKYAYYTDEYKLKKEGKLGRRSKLERVFYDWNTGEEVKRELVSEDYYSGERDTYWVGVHKP